MVRSVDYGIINSQQNTPKFNLAGGFQQGQLTNILSQDPAMSPAMQQYSRINPVDALKMQQSALNRSTGKMSVFDKKLAAGKRPEVQDVVDKWNAVLQEAISIRQADPKASIVKQLQDAAALEEQYGRLMGRPMKNAMSAKMVNELAKERGYTEKAGDDAYQTSNKVVDTLIKETDKILAKYRASIPDMKEAMDLMESAVEDPENINKGAIASAVKKYVKSLDNSVVNAGEISQVAGGSVLDQMSALVNGLTKGVKYDASQLRDFYNSMKSLASTADGLLDKHESEIINQGNALLDMAVSSGRLPQDSIPSYQANIKDLLIAKMAPYRLETKDTPEFTEVQLLGPLGSKSKGKYTPKTNPLADVDF